MAQPPYRNEGYERDDDRRRERDDSERYRSGYGQQESHPLRRFGGRSFGSRSGYGYAGGERGFGGERGDYTGRGPKNYRRSDQRIQEEVCDRLTSDPHVDASEIQVSVKDSEVTLEGTVFQRHMKRLAEDCVETVSGVSQVHNRLRVEPSSAQHSQGSHGQQGEGSLGSVRQSSGRAA